MKVDMISVRIVSVVANSFTSYPNDMDRIDKLNQAIKKVTSSKEEARKFLLLAGIITKKGDLHPRYK